jgi:NADH-quinone oxidoreductase subunit M
MIISLFVAVPLACALLIALTGRIGSSVGRWIALTGNVVTLAFAVFLWACLSLGYLYAPAGEQWLIVLSAPWIPGLGISFTLGLDGLSLLMLTLTSLLGAAAVLCSWKGIDDRVAFFHASLSLVLAGISGVFLALDLFLFVFFWELMLVPMFLLIDLWGHEGRHRAAVKFFLYTQIGGLLMFVAAIGLVLFHAADTGIITFDSRLLIGTEASLPSAAAGMLLMLGFFAAFAVKLPAFPLHAWLPDAHTEAPTAGSVILAGLLLKTGGYGLIRFVLPLFPEAARTFAPVAMWLGAAGIIYGALMAFSQTDMKRLVAYTSVSHLGFVLMGVFAGNAQALSGAVIQMLSHGLGTGALFILVGGLQDRMHTRDMSRMGGLWRQAPRMGAFATVLTMALVGLPGLGNFIGEFLVLSGTYRVNAAQAVAAGIGLVMAMIYALRMLQMVFHGSPKGGKIPDLSSVETLVLAVLVAALVWIGLFPQGALQAIDGLIGLLGQLAFGGAS